jgi:hypothetical protein
MSKSTKFQVGQCVYWHGRLCKVIATKEQAYVTAFPEDVILPPGVKRVIEVPDQFEYVIMEFRHFEEDMSGWFAGNIAAKGHELMDGTSAYSQMEQDEIKRRNSKPSV